MAQQRGRGGGSGYPPTNNTPRQNEYFVPRDGIDREVITADICRYLGNDALVRPGTHTDDSGRVVQGYFITAYRNLTSDSQTKDIQQQRQDRGGGGNMGIPANGNGASYGGMQPSYGGNGAGVYETGARYTGGDSPGYNTTGTGGPGAAPYAAPAGHGGYNNASYAPSGLPPQAQYPAQSPAAHDPRFGGPPPPIGGMGNSYGAPINNVVHPPHAQDGYASGAHYAVSSRDMYSMDMQMTDAPVAPARRATPPGANGAFGNPGNNARAAYGAAPPPPHSAGYSGYSGPPPPTSHAAAYAPPIDGGYGRAPNTSPGFNPVHDMTPPPPHAQHGQQAGSRLPRDQRAVGERSDLQMRDRDRERDRDGTPPNRNGAPPKPSNVPPQHHVYARR
ncbi:MAG: hypothetical protein STHCBS139747_005695 [Sporothrix thermara]